MNLEVLKEKKKFQDNFNLILTNFIILINIQLFVDVVINLKKTGARLK